MRSRRSARWRIRKSVTDWVSGKFSRALQRKGAYSVFSFLLQFNPGLHHKDFYFKQSEPPCYK
jgi:hypothetical protein